jgi:hypothetical protein
MKDTAWQEFAGRIFFQPLLRHQALDQLVHCILGAKPRYRHELTVAWHTFMAPIEGPDFCEMLL